MGKSIKAEKPKARTATVRWVRISPRKVRLVADLVRGQKVDAALGILSFVPRRGSKRRHARRARSKVAAASSSASARSPVR